MAFSRKFPVGRFDLGLRRIGLNAQNSVVVDHCASLSSESQRWMSGLPEVTASLAVKYNTACKYYSLLNATQMAAWRWGVPRGAGEITSSGIRGGEDV